MLMARYGSKRLVNKNLAEFGPTGNKTTLLEWKIKQLLEVFPRQQIIFSSDSNKYLEIGAQYGIKLHQRDSELSDNGTFAENLRIVAKEATTDLVMYSNGPCNPLIGPKRILNFLDFAKKENLEEGIFAVEELKGYVAFQERWLNFEPGENHLGSENLENVFRVVWGLSLRSRKSVILDGSMFKHFNSSYKVPFWTAIDIDYPEDLVMAQTFLDKYIEYEKEA
jgi:CMP-N-acetylneuraminic acid synthetase